MFSFRTKLFMIVGTASLGLLLYLSAAAVTQKRVESQLHKIQKDYLPRTTLEPELATHLEAVRRGFLDAVSAQEPEALSKAEQPKALLLSRLDGAKASLNPKKVGQLKAAVQDYYQTADDLSRRMIRGETGEALMVQMAEMQSKYLLTKELLTSTTAFNKHQLRAAFSAAVKVQREAFRLKFLISIACLVAVVLLSLWLSSGILRSLAALKAGFARFGQGEFTHHIIVATRDELGDVANKANQMADNLRLLNEQRAHADWLKSGQAGLSNELRGELDPHEVARRAVRFLSQYMDAPAAALYYTEKKKLLLLGHYSIGSANERPTQVFPAGEGLVGQALLDQEIRIIDDLPQDYWRIRSGLGERTPSSLLLVPLIHLGHVNGVAEFALFSAKKERNVELLRLVRETLSIAIEVAQARSTMQTLLAEAQEAAQRLSAQEEELKANNEELQTQQEELKQTNEELTQQTEELEAQRRVLEEKNDELTNIRRTLEQQAEELKTVSAYKSQFLANMSHELRTPLNSMLLLSNLLADNERKNLTAKQVEYAKTINSAGKDLLGLINQVLDLAKVEAGKQEIRIEAVSPKHWVDYAKRIFEPMAKAKHLNFIVELDQKLPKTITTDTQRIEQVLNNLLSNAIKFTDQGEVVLRIHKAATDTVLTRDDLQVEKAIALSVSDTGPGIAPENQERIFAPFEQVEGGADRRHGGTGLGLTIARELVTLLGGELQLESKPGEGTTFTAYIPHEWSEAAAKTRKATKKRGPVSNSTGETTARSEEPSSDYVLLIEDDPDFSSVVSDVIKGLGLVPLVASDGRSGLQLAQERKPAGIILDVMLPDIDGWAVMKELRKNQATSSIPIHVVSAFDASEKRMEIGDADFSSKPVTRTALVNLIQSIVPLKARHLKKTEGFRVLIVEDDLAVARSVQEWLASEAIESDTAGSANDALNRLDMQHYGCMILDLSLPDMEGMELLQKLEKEARLNIPVIVYTGQSLSKRETQQLQGYVNAIVLKDGLSAERLIDEVRLFLHQLSGDIKPQGARRLHPADIRLEGKKVLVVDDDMRTVYALSAMLQAKGVKVVVADTGKAAIDVLTSETDIDAVLMDVMMPEMDGHAAVKKIREELHLSTLPIIMLTAKAMKGDREISMAAGATDYMAKPIDSELLFNKLQIHLFRN